MFRNIPRNVHKDSIPENVGKDSQKCSKKITRSLIEHGKNYLEAFVFSTMISLFLITSGCEVPAMLATILSIKMEYNLVLNYSNLNSELFQPPASSLIHWQW